MGTTARVQSNVVKHVMPEELCDCLSLLISYCACQTACFHRPFWQRDWTRGLETGRKEGTEHYFTTTRPVSCCPTGLATCSLSTGSSWLTNEDRSVCKKVMAAMGSD